MPPKRWFLPAPTSPAATSLGAALGVSPFIADLLLRRKFAEDATTGSRFLDPKLEHLHDPLLLPDAPVAVERLARAIREGEQILIHGDYDVDGVCAAALTTRVLRVLKANVDVFVPHRQIHGYDLRVSTVQEAAARGVRVIMTVDCGIVAFEAAEAAREFGIDLIITDHHEPHPSGRLPDALAIVNPKREGSRYPFHELCGTGVAYKLCTALVEHLGVNSTAFRTAFLDLVALATCADCMPLIDENRVFVKWGLETLRKTNKAGLQALLRLAGQRQETVSARTLGFVLGPRINAIGRLDASEHALKLLLTSDVGEAEQLAELLEKANRDRQLEQERTLQEALRQAEHYLEDHILVLASERWHPGIIGIVASKIVESLCRPTVMISIDAEAQRARGSCRSVDGFHIFEALNACREHLERCGGHQAAAGFDLLPPKLEDFRTAMRDFAARELDEDLLQPSVSIDAELPLSALEMRFAKELALLEPFGHGNHEPVFMTRSLQVVDQRRIGARNGSGVDHLKLQVHHPLHRFGLDGVFWRAWGRAQEAAPGAHIDACYTLEIDTFSGQPKLRLNLKDLRTVETS